MFSFGTNTGITARTAKTIRKDLMLGMKVGWANIVPEPKPELPIRTWNQIQIKDLNPEPNSNKGLGSRPKQGPVTYILM